ncbi:MAG TPA: ATP-binding protein [Ilumatobacteraceae bacterium]|nr:ATP-binding protein [Ilumatobacteraceae bacterium]
MDSTVDRQRRTFAAAPASARAARQFVAEVMHAHGATTGVIDDYALAVSELVTNAIEHTASSDLEIIFNFAEPQWWEVEVVCGAPVAPKQLLAPETWTIAGAHEVSGRGLGIVRQLMDDVVTDVAADRVSVRCRRRQEASN